jgi:hypothetical protein
MPAGRPLSLTPERRAAVGELLAAGAPIRTTAIAVGLSERTVHRWVKAGIVGRPPKSPGRSGAFEANVSPAGRFEVPQPELVSIDELLELRDVQ